jgi:hypothetical protein
MAESVLVDAGFLIALLSRRDEWNLFPLWAEGKRFPLFFNATALRP